jgi:hypothetical protein
MSALPEISLASVSRCSQIVHDTALARCAYASPTPSAAREHRRK